MKPPHQFHYRMHGPLRHGESAAFKTTIVGLIQSLFDAKDQARWTCSSALGWTLFAVLWVSGLDSWETALLSCRDEVNTSQMFEDGQTALPEESLTFPTLRQSSEEEMRWEEARGSARVWDGLHVNGVGAGERVCIHPRQCLSARPRSRERAILDLRRENTNVPRHGDRWYGRKLLHK